MILASVEVDIISAEEVIRTARQMGGFTEEELRMPITPGLVGKLFIGNAANPALESYGVRVLDYGISVKTTRADGQIDRVSLHVAVEVFDKAKLMVHALDRYRSGGKVTRGEPVDLPKALLTVLLLNVPATSGLAVVSSFAEEVPEDLNMLIRKVEAIDDSNTVGPLLRSVLEQYPNEYMALLVMSEQLEALQRVAERAGLLIQWMMDSRARKLPWFLKPTPEWDQSVGEEYERQRKQLKDFLERALRGATMDELIRMARFVARETAAVPADEYELFM